jgi:hypothetical protein
MPMLDNLKDELMKESLCDLASTHEHTMPWFFSCFRPSNWLNPNFRTNGTPLKPLIMVRLVGEQEPNEN